MIVGNIYQNNISYNELDKLKKKDYFVKINLNIFLYYNKNTNYYMISEKKIKKYENFLINNL